MIYMVFLKELITNWKTHPEQNKRVIAFGSSNTELHWHSLGHFNWFSWLSSSLREWIGRQVTCINQGINGETVVDLVIRLERDILSFHPNVVIITIGGNDTWKKIEIEEYIKNLSNIIERVQEIGAIPILQTYYCLLYDKMDEIFQNFPDYVEVNRKLALEKNIPILDQYKYFRPYYEQDSENYSKLMLDGLHVNPLGNAIMGILACRRFNLPDPVFYDESFKRQVRNHLKVMNNYFELPKKIRVKELKD